MLEWTSREKEKPRLRHFSNRLSWSRVYPLLIRVLVTIRRTIVRSIVPGPKKHPFLLNSDSRNTAGTKQLSDGRHPCQHKNYCDNSTTIFFHHHAAAFVIVPRRRHRRRQCRHRCHQRRRRWWRRSSSPPRSTTMRTSATTPLSDSLRRRLRLLFCASFIMLPQFVHRRLRLHLHLSQLICVFLFCF